MKNYNYFGFILLIALIINFYAIYCSDNNISKCNAHLKQHIYNKIQNKDKNKNNLLNNSNLIPCFIKISNNICIKEIESKGAIINTIAGNILTADIPDKIIIELAAIQSIERIEMASKLDFYVDTIKKFIGADNLISGKNTLAKKITGKGVIIGIIDTGIDIYHKEFRKTDDTTKSKILRIWSQGISTGNKPKDYDYGVEFTKEEIENELDGSPENLVTVSDSYMGHGTHVAGIAAGNRGIAPDAELVVVQLSFNYSNYFSTKAVDAVNYIFNIANQQNKPCVINASFGKYLEISHDGSDLFSQAINNLINEKPGRVFVASAGNSGSAKYHFGKSDLLNDTIWTYYHQYDNESNIYINIPKINKSDLKISIETDSVINSNTIILGKTPWFSFNDIISNPETTIYYCKNKYEENDVLASFSISASDLNSDFTELLISTNQKTNLQLFHRIRVFGSGSFHSWSNIYSNLESGYLVLPINAKYIKPDNLYIIGPPAIANRVIAVGSYVNRYTYTTTEGIIQPYIGNRNSPGKISQFSSIGPRIDEIIKPDIVAPGENVISAKAKDFWGSSSIVEDSLYIAMSGTSMSSPAVAGGIALLLELDPTINHDNLLKIIKENAIQDDFTLPYNPIPNNTWGWGKFNIQKIIENNFVNIINNDIIISNFEYYPNPAYDNINLCFDYFDAGLASIRITNLLGITKFSSDYYINKGNNRININTANLRTGIYLISINIADKQYNGKIIIN